MAFTLGAAPAQAQESGGTAIATTASTTFTSGRGLVALINWAHASATVSSVQYDPGGANQTNFTAIGSAVAQGTDRCHMYYLSNVPTTKSTTIRCTWSAGISGGGFLNVKELISGDTTTLLDNSGSGTGTSTNPNCSVTTLTANCCIFATCSSTGADPAASGTGYVLISVTDPNWFAAGEYNLDVGTAAAKTVTMTAASGTWCFKAASFKLAAAAVVKVPPPKIVSTAVHRSFSW